MAAARQSESFSAFSRDIGVKLDVRPQGVELAGQIEQMKPARRGDADAQRGGTIVPGYAFML